MQVRAGDKVKMRDGRIVDVTDAADQNLFAYPKDGTDKVFPAETIFVGTTEDGGTVVSDMSEVVSILN